MTRSAPRLHAVPNTLEIRALLHKDPYWSVYALGDLDARRAHHCDWFTHGDSVALLYREFDSPILWAAGDPAVLDAVPDVEGCHLQIPESFLSIFDSFVARKKKPVSIVRNGVCGECHLQIAVGILGSLAFGQGVQQCGNCGRFLYFPEDESVFAPEPSPNSKGVRSGKEASAHVA